MRHTWSRRVCICLVVAAAAVAVPASAVEVFVAIDPCRLFDTRLAGDAPALDNTQLTSGLGPTVVRTVAALGNANCPALPSTGVTAIGGNVIVVRATAPGFLAVFPEDTGFENTSHLNFPEFTDASHAATVNGHILPLDDDGEIGVAWQTVPTSLPDGTDTAHVVFDVTGYFVTLETDDGIAFTGTGPVVLGLDVSFQLPQSCGSDQVPAWDGDSWECADAGGDVTDVFAGTGLEVEESGGPQPTLSLAPAFALPTGCGAGEIAVWDGDSWECAVLTGGGEGAVVVSHAARHNQLSTSQGAVTFGPAGASNPTDVQTTSPAAQRIEILSPESGCVAQRMRVRQVHPTDADPVSMGAGQQRIFRLLVNGGDSALTCTILADQDTCLSVGTATIAAGGQRLSISTTNDGTGSFPTADGLITWECVVAP